MRVFSEALLPLNEIGSLLYTFRMVVLKARGELKQNQAVVEGEGRKASPKPQGFRAGSAKSAGLLLAGTDFAAGAATGAAVAGKDIGVLLYTMKGYRCIYLRMYPGFLKSIMYFIVNQSTINLSPVVAGVAATKEVKSHVENPNEEGTDETDEDAVKELVKDYVKQELSDATDLMKDKAKGAMIALAELEVLRAQSHGSIPRWLVNLFNGADGKSAIKKILLIFKESINYAMVYVLVVLSNYMVDFAMVRVNFVFSLLLLWSMI